MSDVAPADLVPSDNAGPAGVDIDPASVRAFLVQHNTELVTASPRSRSRAIAANIAAHSLHALVAAGGVAGAVVTVPQLPEHVVHGGAMGVTFVSGLYLGIRWRDARLRRGLETLEAASQPVDAVTSTVACDPTASSDRASERRDNRLAGVAIVGLFSALPFTAHQVGAAISPSTGEHDRGGFSFICGIGGSDAEVDELDTP